MAGRGARKWGSLWTCTRCTSTPSSRWSPASSERYSLHSGPAGARVLPRAACAWPAVCAQDAGFPPLPPLSSSGLPCLHLSYRSCPLLSSLRPSSSSSPPLVPPLSPPCPLLSLLLSVLLSPLVPFPLFSPAPAKGGTPVPSSSCGFVSWVCRARVEVQFPRRLPLWLKGRLRVWPREACGESYRKPTFWGPVDLSLFLVHRPFSYIGDPLKASGGHRSHPLSLL